MEYEKSYFYKASEWIYFLFVTNILWLVGILLGGVILGVVPSTIILFKSIRNKIYLGEGEISLATWWTDYKNYFWRTQVIGVSWMLVGFVIYIDFKIVMLGEGPVTNILLIILSAVSIIYISSTFLFISIYVHYEFKPFDQIRLSLLLSLIYPYFSGLFLIVLFAGYFAWYYVPTIFLFLGVSFFTLLLMLVTLLFFSKAENNQLIILK